MRRIWLSVYAFFYLFLGLPVYIFVGGILRVVSAFSSSGFRHMVDYNFVPSAETYTLKKRVSSGIWEMTGLTVLGALVGFALGITGFIFTLFSPDPTKIEW